MQISFLLVLSFLFIGAFVHQMGRLVIKVVSLKVLRRSLFDGRFFANGKFGMKLICYFLREISLDRENITDRPVVMFCPNMFVGLGIDQLCIQVNRASISAHTSFKNMRDMQTFSDLLHVS